MLDSSTLHPPPSFDGYRKSATKHDQAVFREFLDALWTDEEFLALHQWVIDELSPVLFDDPQLAETLVMSTAMEIGRGRLWASGVDGYPGSYGPHPAVASVLRRLVAVLRPHAEAICGRIHPTLPPRSLIWVAVALLWPGGSAQQQYEKLEGSYGTVASFSVHLDTAALEPEPDAPEDVLRKEGIDMQAEVRGVKVPSSPFAVPWNPSGRPRGSNESFKDREDFRSKVREAIQEIRKQRKYPSCERVAEHLHGKGVLRSRGHDEHGDPNKQLSRARRSYGYPSWGEVLKDLEA